MGRSVQKITENVSLIASTDTWIEGLAVQQLIKTSELGIDIVKGSTTDNLAMAQNILYFHWRISTQTLLEVKV